MIDHLALAVPPLLLAVPAMLLAIAAMVLAARTPDPLRRSHRRALRFRDDKQRHLNRLLGQVKEYEALPADQRAPAPAPEERLGLAAAAEDVVPPHALAQAIPASAPEPLVLPTPEPPPTPDPTLEPELVPEPAPEPQPQPPPSPLDEKRAYLTGYLDHLLASLDSWARLAGFDLDATVGVRAQVSALVQAVQPPAQDETLSAVANERLPILIAETAKVMLSKTDRDCDPARANPPLQEHIDRFLQPETSWRLSVIDPQDNDPLDSREHDSVGIVATASAAERGTVARTRVRGLRWKDQVVARAEVLEYD